MSSVPSILYQPTPGNYALIPVSSIPFDSGLTTPLQASVANPALGFATIFVNASGQLSLTDSVGNTVLLLDSPASHSQNMNSNSITGVLSESYIGSIQINKSGGANANINIGSGAVASGTTCVLISANTCFATGANDIVIGTNNQSSLQYGITIGANNRSTAFAATCLGGGNTGNHNAQSNSLSLGSDQVLLAGNGGIALGNGAGLGLTNDAIAIGTAAVNNTSSSCLIGDVAITDIRPNNDAACDLGTPAAEFKDIWLSNGVRGPLAPASNYSTYDNTVCNNTVAETDISTTASSIGSLTLDAGQPLGMVFELSTCMTASSVAGDNLTIRYKSNGGLLFSHVLTIPALSVDLPIDIESHVTIRNGTIHVCSVSNTNGTVANVVSSAIVYDRTIADAWSVTAQWGANVNQLTCGQLYAKSFFRG